MDAWMDKVSINCPACKRESRAPSSFIGKVVKCNRCGHSFTLERLATRSEELRQESPEQMCVSCPACKRESQAPVSYIGKVVKCNRCSHSFTLERSATRSAVPEKRPQDVT